MTSVVALGGTAPPAAASPMGPTLSPLLCLGTMSCSHTRWVLPAPASPRGCASSTKTPPTVSSTGVSCPCRSHETRVGEGRTRVVWGPQPSEAQAARSFCSASSHTASCLVAQNGCQSPNHHISVQEAGRKEIQRTGGCFSQVLLVSPSFLTLCDPVNCITSLSFTMSPSFLKLTSAESVMSSSRLLLSPPSPPALCPSQLSQLLLRSLPEVLSRAPTHAPSVRLHCTATHSCKEYRGSGEDGWLGLEECKCSSLG